MRTNYLRHLANIVDILWSRAVGGGGGGGATPNGIGSISVNAKKCNFAFADNHDAVLEVIDRQAIL